MARYLQLAEALRSEVEGLPSNERIASERDLAERFGVSRMTMRHAVEQLVESGVLYRVQGSGTFVRDRAVAKGVELVGFTEEMLARGMRPSSRMVTAHTIPAGSRIGADLRISPSESVYCIERVRSADGEPMAHERMWIPAKPYSRFLDSDLSGSIYSVLRDKFGLQPASAQQVVRPVTLDERSAEMLSVPPTSVALQIKRTAYSQWGVPLETTTSLFRGDRYALSFLVRTRRRPGA